MMQCVAVYIICIYCLESSNLKLNAGCPLQLLFEEVLFQYLYDMAFACSWSTMYQSNKLVRFFSPSVECVVFVLNDLFHT